MIVILGHPGESMIENVCQELADRKARFLHINNADIPTSVSFTYPLGGEAASQPRFDWNNGEWLDAGSVTAIYHRLGFSSFEVFEGYSSEEVQFVGNECATALQTWMNWHPGTVVSRPRSSGSNASKPYQSALLRQLGFCVPRTLVTNRAEAAREFYEAMGGAVIYKSISYTRSIVKRFQPEDLGRLDTLENCPVQLQQAVEGFDVRVHVVGDQLFATRIAAESSDYRYDKQAEIVPFELPDWIEEMCFQVADQLELPLTGIDLRLTPEGEAYCFEANPSPAFTWYEARTGQPITAALCDLLQSGGCS